MVSSSVMVSRAATTNPDQPRYTPPPSSLIPDDELGLGSMNMDDFLGSIYTDQANGVEGGWVEPMMTLEAYLAKAGAVTEEDVRVSTNMDATITSSTVEPPQSSFGKRRAVQGPPLDKAAQQKQRRMIKNRESAARSRERKQAYTLELEALVTRLEEENARLFKEEAELKKQRFKQLIEELKPVVEKRRPPKAVMRRSSSMSW